jgi:hypothetical protein
VQPGDTLSGIAASHGVSLSQVEAANPQLSSNFDLIYAGQQVNLSGGGGALTSPSSHSTGLDGDGDHDGDMSDGPAQSAPVHHSAPMSSPANTGYSGGYSSSSSLSDVPGVPSGFAACVALRESSNNPRSVNAVPGFEGKGGGAYGIMDYVWQGSDLNKSGQPYNASLSEQKQAFSTLYQKYGKSPWTPSDGC